MAKHKGVFRTKHKAGKTTVYAKRDSSGRFVDIQSLKRTVSLDARKKTRTKVKSGYGFRGDIK